jgi:MtaA/CmuA family methyltransferase
MIKENMTSRERVLACINNEEFDRIPLICPTSVATLESCRQIGVLFNEVHLDADKMAALASTSYDFLGFDSIMPYFSVIQEAAAFGCEINWGSGEAMPNQKSTVFDDPEQFRLPDDLLDRKPLKTVIDAIKLLRKKYGNDVAIIGKVMGPWTLSYHLYGVENLLIDTIEDPEKVRAFLDKFKEISLRFAEAQFEAGADILTWADHATGDLVSPQTYKDFLLPVHKEINKRLSDKIVILHCCGNTYDRIQYFAEAGFPIFHFDSRNDIRKSLEAAGNMKLTGCINNPNILLNGSIGDVENQVGEIIESGIKLISPECAIPLKVKNENLTAIKKAMIKYQRK